MWLAHFGRKQRENCSTLLIRKRCEAYLCCCCQYSVHFPSKEAGIITDQETDAWGDPGREDVILIKFRAFFIHRKRTRMYHCPMRGLKWCHVPRSREPRRFSRELWVHSVQSGTGRMASSTRVSTVLHLQESHKNALSDLPDISTRQKDRQLLPPANEVWDKVIFSQASISHLSTGEGVCLWVQVCTNTPLNTPLRTHLPSPEHTPGHTHTHTPNKWVACILLECFLV